MFTNLNLTDMETCYKAFRVGVLRGISLQQDRFGFEVEITAKVAKLGARVFEVPISYSGRTYAEGKKIGWKDGFNAIACIVRYGLEPNSKAPFQAANATAPASRDEVVPLAKRSAQ
jgi:hypothetical protein